MTDVHLLPRRFSREGAERLAKALEQAIVVDADLGPRWPQIQAIGLSLQQLSLDLQKEADRLEFEHDAIPETETFRDSLRRLTEVFMRLGAIAQAYPSTI